MTSYFCQPKKTISISRNNENLMPIWFSWFMSTDKQTKNCQYKKKNFFCLLFEESELKILNTEIKIFLNWNFDYLVSCFKNLHCTSNFYTKPYISRGVCVFWAWGFKGKKELNLQYFWMLGFRGKKNQIFLYSVLS